MTAAHGSAAPEEGAVKNRSVVLRLELLLARRRGPLECVVWLVTALASATLLRLAVSVITSGMPLVLYFPAISIVALFTGWECGAIAVAASALLAWYLFFPPVLIFHVPTPQQAVVLIFWCLVGGTQVVIAQFLRLALLRALHSETRYRRLLNAAAGTIWTANERGEIDVPQASWAALTGMSWPSYAKRDWLTAVHPEDRALLGALEKGTADGLQENEIRIWNMEAGDWRWYLARSVPLPCLSGDGTEWITALDNIHERKLANDRRDIVIGELRHRLKNLLTVIDALAKNSRSRVDTSEQLEAFLKRFLGRLHALGAAADLILAGQRVAVDCGSVVRASLSPFIEERAARFLISGADLRLSEQTGSSLGLAVHELATNAVKYGALSTQAGIVRVSWSASALEDGTGQVVFEWKERGGPPPVPPSREGFGTRLIRSVPARERGGEVDIRYEPDGLYCRISFVRSLQGPMAELRRDAAE